MQFLNYLSGRNLFYNWMQAQRYNFSALKKRKETEHQMAGGNKEFLLGCNYWASHAGTDMWRVWEESTVREDFKRLKENGITYVRMFINWKDFQPVEALYGSGNERVAFCMPGDKPPTNPCYLDERMTERFHCFCGIAEEYGLKLIVGLVTGWMSGRLFTPPALAGKNLFTDPLALMFEQLLIKGIVSGAKEEKAIYAWDLGNECNCMGKTERREEAYNWTSVITNAIRACDPIRPIISGMHSLEIEGTWNIADQGGLTDILTTHPYPLWVEHCSTEPVSSFRVLLHATAQTQYYRDIGKKECLVEEIGTMGPMICNEAAAAGFMKINLYSNWANGAKGLLWWCANEQSHLEAPPYEWNMCERELGMFDKNHAPKPMLLEMKAFAAQLPNLPQGLPYRRTDAVCILSQGQDHWGIAYMTYALAKQAGLTIDFAYSEQEIPESPVYFLPSVTRPAMNKSSYECLKKKVEDGSDLYISIDDAFLTEFEEFTGLRVICASGGQRWGRFLLKDDVRVDYQKRYRIQLEPIRAEVLAEDEDHLPIFTCAEYGKGHVYFLNFPMEKMLLTDEKAFEQEYFEVYKLAAGKALECRYAVSANRYVGVTEHIGDDGVYAVLVNYSLAEQSSALTVKKGWSREAVVYGNPEMLEPGGMAIIRIKENKR